MSDISRRDVVRALGGLVPAGIFVGASASAGANSPSAQSGAVDEQRAAAFIASVKPAVVLFEVETERSIQWGSGFFVSSDGLALTNRHVVKGGLKVTCIHKNKDKLPARVLKIDNQYDLALVKVEVPQPVATVDLGDSEEASAGTLVAVTGYPEPGFMVWMGMALDSSTSRGSVNGLRRGSDVNAYLGDQALQIDAPVTHGNSGGPVYRLDDGKVIGVLLGGHSTAQNVRFAVPINPARVLISGSGQRPKANLVKATSAEAVVEPGELRALNTISVTKELPPLFGYGFQITRSFDVRNTAEAIQDWEVCTGQNLPKVAPMVLHNDEIFFGATDGRLRSWNVTDVDAGAPILVDVEASGQIFVHPPVVNDQVICGTAGALDLRSQWRSRKDIAAVLLPGLFGGSREHITAEGVGYLFGINRRNGNIDWEIETGFVSTPVLFQNRVYYGGLGERGCVDVLQGKEFWKFKEKPGDKPDWYHIGHVDANGVIAVVVPTQAKRTKDEAPLTLMGQDDAMLAIYDPATGKPKDKMKPIEFGNLKDRQRPMSTAMFYDEKKKIAYVLAAQIVAAIDVGNWKKLWAYDHQKTIEEAQKKKKGDKGPKSFSFTSAMVIQDGIIYIGATDRKLRALNGADGKEIWVYNTRGEVGMPSYYDGQILVGSGDGYLHVVDARTGSLNWRVRTGSPVRSQPIVRAAMVYAATEDGDIYTVRFPSV